MPFVHLEYTSAGNGFENNRKSVAETTLAYRLVRGQIVHLRSNATAVRHWAVMLVTEEVAKPAEDGALVAALAAGGV